MPGLGWQGHLEMHSGDAVWQAGLGCLSASPARVLSPAASAVLTSVLRRTVASCRPWVLGVLKTDKDTAARDARAACVQITPKI